MRFKTLVLIPVIAVLATYVVSLPVTQSQISANAPQSIASVVSQDRVIRASELATYKKESNKEKTRSNEKASRSKNTSKYSGSKVKANQAFAKSYMQSKYSWGKNQHSCLVNLWNRESGWRHTAANPSSSAYGIPQSLPGKKMASAGADWRTNPETQIKWGLKYIKNRYETPCGAWGAFKKKGWY
jgi:hypothetical protein